MNAPHTPPEDESDFKAPGPFSVPGRNWILVVFLWGILLLKYGVILGSELPWFGYLGGSLVFIALPLLAGWLGWKWTGERPYWGDNAFIGAAAVLFVLFSIPAYAVGLG